MGGEINFRDFGGYQTAGGNQVTKGMLYRSATLSRLIDSDIPAVNKLGLKRIIDLRTQREIDHGGYDKIYSGNESKYDFLNFGYGDPYLINAIVASELEWNMKRVDFPSIYINMLEQNKSAIQQMFNRFADPMQYPILIHCTQGKDRTGIIVALLLLILGVPEATIMEDYMLTEKLADIQARLSEMEQYLSEFEGSVPAGVTADDWAPFFKCLPDSLENFFTHLELEYGGIAKFLKSIRVDQLQQKAILGTLIECSTGSRLSEIP